MPREKNKGVDVGVVDGLSCRRVEFVTISADIIESGHFTLSLDIKINVIEQFWGFAESSNNTVLVWC